MSTHVNFTAPGGYRNGATGRGTGGAAAASKGGKTSVNHPARHRVGIVALLLAAVSLFASLLVAMPQASAAADSSGPQLNNLIIDKVYQLTPVEVPEGVEVSETGFAPEVTEYTGTAYQSVTAIQIYPFVDSGVSVSLTADGESVSSQTTSNRYTYFPLSINTVGTYSIEIKVSRGFSSNTYKIELEKVNTDYRGRAPIYEDADFLENVKVYSDLSSSTSSLKSVVKSDTFVGASLSGVTNWSINSTQEGVGSSPFPTTSSGEDLSDGYGLFTVDLGKTYDVSKIRGIFSVSAGKSMSSSNHKVQISVSTDGKNWESPITAGRLHKGQFNAVLYDFGASYEARYIRVDITSWSAGTFNALNLYQFMIFTDPAEDADTAGEASDSESTGIDGGTVAHQNESRHQYLSRAQATVIEFGLTVTGWTPSEGYGRAYTTAEEKELIGYSGPVFYDVDMVNSDYMDENPDSVWGITKAPFGTNGAANSGDPREYLEEEMLEYISNAIAFGFGDEGSYSTSEARALAKWFEWTHDHYPAVLTFTNQYPGQWNGSIAEYMDISEPDMLMFDDYYGDTSFAQPGSFNLSDNLKNAARELLAQTTWAQYRQYASEGWDGSGVKPITYGQYLDSFAFNRPESSKALIFNLSLLSGMKYLIFFRLEYQFDRSYFFDEDGTPMRGALEWGEIIRTAQAMDEQLMRLNSDWIMIKGGSIASSDSDISGYQTGKFDSNAEKNAEYGLSQVTVESKSTAYSGGTGDVVLGYYDPLTGLYESEIAENFAGYTAPKAFTVLNALTTGSEERYNVSRIGLRESGSSANTQQEITVTVDSDFASKYKLYKVNTDNLDSNGKGTIEEVKLDDNQFTTVLGGGEMELYFWGINSTASATSEAEGAYASFAFDESGETYWQPSEATENGVYELTQTFDEAVSLNEVTIVENGDNVESFTVKYQDENGTWQDYAKGATIDGATSVTYGEGLDSASTDSAILATAIKIEFTSTKALPAIYTVELDTVSADENTEYTMTINDNELGSGLFRFDYSDGIWSYREVETTSSQSAYTKMYPINYDGHFSHYANQTATFKFYGTDVTLHLRGDKNNTNLKARVLNADGSEERKWTTASSTSLVFTDLSDENQVYTLEIQTINTSGDNGGIDGATVTYKGSISDALVEENSAGTNAIQEYLNQTVICDSNDTDTAAGATGETNCFTYSGTVKEVTKSQAEANTSADSSESTGWVQYGQNATYMNVGFTRTKQNEASFTVKFTGTGITLYTATSPLGNSGSSYGTAEFTLDGNDVTDEVINVIDAAGVTKNMTAARSVPTWRIDAGDSNAAHELTVTFANSGSTQYGRIDYAVVDKVWDGESAGSLQVNAPVGTGGTVALSGDVTNGRLALGGNLVVTVTPDSGYQLDELRVNGDKVIVPESGRYTLTNVTEDVTVSATFTTAKYTISLDETMSGGSVAADVYTTTSGTTVTLTPAVFTGYEMVSGSLTVTGSDGTSYYPTTNGDGTYMLTMPAANVTVSASFKSLNGGDTDEGGSGGDSSEGDTGGDTEGGTEGGTGSGSEGSGSGSGSGTGTGGSSGDNTGGTGGNANEGTVNVDDSSSDAGSNDDSLAKTGAALGVGFLALALVVLGAMLLMSKRREQVFAGYRAQHRSNENE